MAKTETIIFDSEFHKKYVGGKGVVEDKGWSTVIETEKIVGDNYDEILKQYRKYVGDPNAQLPESLESQLRLQGKIK